MQITKETSIDEIILHLTDDYHGSHTLDESTGEMRESTWGERVGTAKARIRAINVYWPDRIPGAYQRGDTIAAAKQRNMGIYPYHDIDGIRTAAEIEEAVREWDARQDANLAK